MDDPTPSMDAECTGDPSAEPVLRWQSPVVSAPLTPGPGLSDIARGPDRFVPKLIFSTPRIEVSTRPDGAVRLDWIGVRLTDELQPADVARLVEKLTKWQEESAP